MAKRLNPNLTKIHRSYTVQEVSQLHGVNKKTVRNWIRNGLPVFDDVRPLLILGTDLRLFIHQQNRTRRRQCDKGEMYCLKCRVPRKPKADSASFIHLESDIGRMFARCSECDSKVNRFFSWRKLEAIRNEFEMEIAVGTKTHNCEGVPSPKLHLA